jgi:hypothetical protein
MWIPGATTQELTHIHEEAERLREIANSLNLTLKFYSDKYIEVYARKAGVWRKQETLRSLRDVQVFLRGVRLGRLT